MPQPIKSPCNTHYEPAYRHDGTRNLSVVRLIVLHDTEGGSASSIAGYFHGQSAQGSAHLVVDDNNCYRCLPNSVIPWGAPGANTDGFHIEQCGYAHWTREQWLDHEMMLHRAAYKAAVHGKLFDIPMKFVDHYGILAGHKGITTHAEVTKAYPKLGSHTDPGAGYPIHHVIDLAYTYRHGL